MEKARMSVCHGWSLNGPTTVLERPQRPAVRSVQRLCTEERRTVGQRGQTPAPRISLQFYSARSRGIMNVSGHETICGAGDMAKTIEAVFDGAVLRPAEPLELEPNTRVRITLEGIIGQKDDAVSFLDTARSLELDGPADWSQNIDAYLYGGSNGNDG